MRILQDIYTNQYSAIETQPKPPEKLRAEVYRLFEKMETEMGREFAEKYWNCMCEEEDFLNYANFREGFRLGVSLMMELL